MSTASYLDLEAWLPLVSDPPTHSRLVDAEIGEALGWRVSRDKFWSEGDHDEWCIRRDGRNDIPCSEALPRFTPDILRAEIARRTDHIPSSGKASR